MGNEKSEADYIDGVEKREEPTEKRCKGTVEDLENG